MGSHSLIGLLAEPERLRVVAALALGADTPSAVAARAGLDLPAVTRVLRRLESGGLVSVADGRVVLHTELFEQAARVEASADRPDDIGVSDPAAAAVLRAFVRDGRLVRIPAAAGKRRVVLEYLASTFEPGVRYPEREVDALLRAWHPDHAALRRYLVDAGLLTREDGVYRRSGGWLDVLTPPVVREQRVAAYGLAEDGGRVLLTRLARGPNTGRWTLPGGGVEFGERPVDTVRREILEETGLTVRVGELLDVDAELVRFERDGRTVEGHPLRILYRVTPTGGTLGVREVGGSTAEAAWLRGDDLDPEALTPFTAAALSAGRLSAAS
jgi:ADP-ribose pyrophosphatase YjhB (NUDIX family)